MNPICPFCNCQEDKQHFSTPNDISDIFKCRTCLTYFNDEKIVKSGRKQDIQRIMGDFR